MRTRPMADGRSNLDDVPRSDDEAFSCLVGHGLGVRSVTYGKDRSRLTVLWHRTPTPDEQDKAGGLIRGAVLAHGI